MASLIPKKVICHHSLTKDSGTVSWGAIRKYHTKIYGWSGIGYHAGIELIISGDEPYYEALFGRPWDRTGAHTRGHNHDSLGICFVGNYDKIAPKKEMLKAGVNVIALWLKLFNLSIDDIYSHHNLNIHKSCPGELFDMEQLKMLVEKSM